MLIRCFSRQVLRVDGHTDSAENAGMEHVTLLLSEMQRHAELVACDPKMASMTKLLVESRADLAKMSQAVQKAEVGCRIVCILRY